LPKSAKLEKSTQLKWLRGQLDQLRVAREKIRMASSSGLLALACAAAADNGALDQYKSLLPTRDPCWTDKGALNVQAKVLAVLGGLVQKRGLPGRGG
jgi:hypothetical protein